MGNKQKHTDGYIPKNTGRFLPEKSFVTLATTRNALIQITYGLAIKTTMYRTA
jgi:hypothetical protein